MNKKNNKFLSFSLAIREILDDFRSDPKQYDLFAKVYSFLVEGKAVPGEEKCPPMGIRYGGIWYRPENLEERQFYNWHEFDYLLTQAFSLRSLSGEDIVKLYKMVTGVNASIDFQIINFTRPEGGRRISYTSTTDNTVKLFI
ncbi:MAG: hypothetical protein LWX54_15805 [Deltaproteobacteria bacterium]|jgi:hypothetical protein|nr:hypothetical protein [Deltaproteobacteria bacterium]